MNQGSADGGRNWDSAQDIQASADILCGGSMTNRMSKQLLNGQANVVAMEAKEHEKILGIRLERLRREILAGTYSIQANHLADAVSRSGVSFTSIPKLWNP